MRFPSAIKLNVPDGEDFAASLILPARACLLRTCGEA